MRIDKFISRALAISRKDARDIIKSKRVKIGNRVALKNDWEVNCEDVFLDDKKIEFKEFYYLMLNKPKGYISATYDEKQKCVLDLIKGYEKANLFMVGRLDIDTVGLLILTNDGPLAHKLTSPKKECFKKYYVEVDGEFSLDDIEKLKLGLDLYDGKGKAYHTKEAILEIISKDKAYISISEGKYHEIKKMCQKLNKEVTYLKRISMGNLVLDESLKEGEYRELTDLEVSILKENC